MKRPAPETSESLLSAPERSRSRSSPFSTPSPRLETPMKRSSASASKSRSNSVLGGTKSSRRGSSNTQALMATNENPRQEAITKALMSELNGAAWYDPNFFQKAIPCCRENFDHILTHCTLLNQDRTRWVSTAPTGPEEAFYTPTITLFNAIGNAVHSLAIAPQPFIPFVDRSKRPLASDYSGMNTFPDIIQCNQQEVPEKLHWHHLARFVEVKRTDTLLREAIRQSARYARALFANQLGQRFVQCAVVCGTGVTFLRFDRSGMIYSDTLDIYKDTPMFIRAFAGWLLLNGTQAGHNPMFTTDPTDSSKHIVTVNGLNYWVPKLLHYRTAIRSRATLVLALKRALDPSSPANLVDAVLKLIWRDQTRFREGLILGKFPGIYGLCQTLFEGDVLIDSAVDIVYRRTGLKPGKLGDVFGSIAENTDIQGATQDNSRVLTQLLMQPGRRLTEAANEFELIAGMIGALMGHWALVGSQVQHRDISVNNILLAVDGYQYPHSDKAPEWEQLPKFGVERCTQDFTVPDWVQIFNESNEPEKSIYTADEKLEFSFNPRRRLVVLERVIQALGRSEPFGFLSDLDMANILSLSRTDVSDVHTHRTGTPTFMAIKLLRATSLEPIRHTFIHDLESFFWVLLYVIADHRDPGVSQLNAAATHVLDQLDTIHYFSLGNAKHATLGDIADGDLNVGTFGTTWARSLAPMVQKFANFVRGIGKRAFDPTADPDACFEDVLSIFLDVIPKIRPDSIPEVEPPPLPVPPCPC
ncbi:unnamed protein product [Rhizoctonia solani]|uniref:Fungal-type protein kinase domain-containing protein n=1 Tax=Rhizoctonia solani TaxID=456999 RepID=A0A8H3D6W2_9AGAM|nr:unnamed protein product [Rhizoctonia solani]